MASDTPAAAGQRKPILVIGGGITGMTAALEAAEAGCECILVEKSPFLGGRVARFHLYFPKLCPPACGLEINYSRIRRNPRITVLTSAQVESVRGSAGDLEATIRIAPRFVNGNCTLCGDCVAVCPAERSDEFNYGLGKTKAAFVSGANPFPPAYAIERRLCPAGCRACAEACRYQAVNLNQAPAVRTFRVAAVIGATGWAPYDVSKLDRLGFGRCANVVTNVMLERMAAPDGPAGGDIVRPSDGEKPRTVVFVQCAGSRDENHLPYCSSVCCAATLKQASYIRARHPDAEITIFYIDVRTPGRLEDFYSKIASDDKIRLIKGKVADVQECPGTRDLSVTAEDVSAGKKISQRASLVVLAAGVVPQTEGLPPDFALDDHRFAGNGLSKPGYYAAGCARRPGDVTAATQDATAAALRALQCVAKSGQHG